MELKFSSNFVVMPADCNYTQKVIFGGTLLSWIDITCAAAVHRLLRSSNTAVSAVTHKVDVEFLKPSHCGDIVFVDVEIDELRKKGIGVKVRVEKEERGSPKRVLVSTGRLVFVSMDSDGKFVHHGLEL